MGERGRAECEKVSAAGRGLGDWGFDRGEGGISEEQMVSTRGWISSSWI